MSEIVRGVGPDYSYRKLTGPHSFHVDGTLTVPATTSTRLVAPADANRIVISLLPDQALRIKRLKVGVFDGLNSGQLIAANVGKLQLQFPPFGLTNSFAEWQGTPFLNPGVQPATTGINLSPELGDYLTLIDDFIAFDDYRDVVGLLTQIGIQAYWQVRNNDGVNPHAVNFTTIGLYEIWTRGTNGS